MATSYNVKIWALQTRYKTDDKGKRIPARYVVRWTVDGQRFEPSFRSRAQADSFRSELLAAARKGEPFDTDTGRPISHAQKISKATWYEFACTYADMKWEDSSPKYRSSIADSLTTITLAMLQNNKQQPPTGTLSPALRRAFNKNLRESDLPSEQAHALRWVSRNTRPLTDLAKTDVLRAVLAELDRKRNGERAAHDTVRLRRITLGNALDYAVERELLHKNPLREMKTRKHTAVLKQVDRRSVVNPIQARTLLLAVKEEVAPRLYAFFALLYFAALRPEEAANIRKHNLSLPEAGWGEIHLDKAAPEIGKAWTDSGKRGEQRSLKHRHDGQGRTVPCSDELTAILHWHLETHGTASDGRLFWGERSGGTLGGTVYARAWKRARQVAFTQEIAASPLAQRPYDLRHAAVSTWLNATGDPVRVAEWAGHSVHVLLKVYAKCLDGGDLQAREQVERRLKGL